MNRREFLSASVVAAFGLPACSSNNTTVTPSEFTNNYAIPPLVTGKRSNGRVQYNLSLQQGNTQFNAGVDTPTWGINGSFLGPTLRLKNGDDVDINFTNNLPEDTTMHGHGMHVPALMDGGVHQVIAPGASWSASYTVNQRACTNWYHPHQMGKTADHVIKGLAGMIIIDDAETAALKLPSTYGVDDIPVIVQDRRFNADGSFDYAPSRMEIMQGWKGDTFLVNGVIKPSLDVPAKQVRFRILNGSNARVYTFAFASNKTFYQIAGDNSLLEKPVALTELRLSPAERAEIIVDFSGASLGTSEIFLDKDSTSLFQVNVTSIPLIPDSPLNTSTQLTTLTTPVLPTSLIPVRKFTLDRSMGPNGSFTINGASMNAGVINEKLPIDTVEVWEVINKMNMVHNFHIHATHFQILERNGSAAQVAENEKGYKDTVYLPPRETVKLIVKMTDYVDASNPYMYHCHILEHEDAGMMGQFVVV